jgi:UDP-N-acetylglucosamine 4,6-dehydratase
MLDDRIVWISGGTGSFGHAFVEAALKTKVKKIIIFSRDEYKQLLMKQHFHQTGYEGYKGDRLRFHLGDVRDRWSVERSIKGANIVVHCSALKQIDTGEYNVLEFIETNVGGAKNVTESATTRGIEQFIGLTTDKAVKPINSYGATKMLQDRIILNANVHPNCKYSLVRYGNVANSRGSIIPRVGEMLERGDEVISITDHRMTRFWITLEEAVQMVMTALEVMQGGETFIPKMPSYKLTSLIEALGAKAWEDTGIRPGEKLHEDMITEYDDVYDNDGYWIVYPTIAWKRIDKQGRRTRLKLSSNTNHWWLGAEELRERI